MKKLSLFRSAFVAVFCAFLLTSCFSERIESLDARPADQIVYGPVIETINITTENPDVTNDPTVFSGKIKMDKERQIEVSYGFFWYDPNDETSVQYPNRIDIGTTKGDLDFSAIVKDLPQERQLIVCAFVQRGEEASEMNIGDEVPFVVPKP